MQISRKLRQLRALLRHVISFENGGKKTSDYVTMKY
jgi:hypothetical protein